MSDSSEFLADDKPRRPSPEKDRYGRYLIVPPDGGDARPHTRMTTFIKALDGQAGDALKQWYARFAMKGVVMSEARTGRVTTFDAEPADKEAKREFNNLLEDAASAAGMNEKREKGTALHDATELVDAGTTFTPAAWMKEPLSQYAELVERFGLTWVESEQIVVLSELGVAGRFDRLVRAPWFPGVRVLDIKTGSIGFPAKFVPQLGGYANADGMYDVETASYRPMPDDIDKQVALVLHLPIDGSPATLHRLDIGQAVRVLDVAKRVRTWNNTDSRGVLKELDPAKTAALHGVAAPAPELVQPDAVFSAPTTAFPTDPVGILEPEPVETTAVEKPAPTMAEKAETAEAIEKVAAAFKGTVVETVPERAAWALARIELLKQHDGGLDVLRKWWPQNVPTPGALRRGEAELDTNGVSLVLDAVVKSCSEAGVADDLLYPFGPPDPLKEVAPEPADAPAPGTAPATELGAVKDHLLSLGQAEQELVKRWLGQAARKSVGFAFMKSPDERKLCIGRCAIAMADRFYDYEEPTDAAAGHCHAALDMATGETDRAAVGVRLGRLSHAQARVLLGVSTHGELGFGLDGVPVINVKAGD